MILLFNLVRDVLAFDQFGWPLCGIAVFIILLIIYDLTPNQIPVLYLGLLLFACLVFGPITSLCLFFAMGHVFYNGKTFRQMKLDSKDIPVEPSWSKEQFIERLKKYGGNPPPEGWHMNDWEILFSPEMTEIRRKLIDEGYLKSNCPPEITEEMLKSLEACKKRLEKEKSNKK